LTIVEFKLLNERSYGSKYVSFSVIITPRCPVSAFIIKANFVMKELIDVFLQ